MKVVACDRSHSAQILELLNEAIQNTTALWDYQPRTLESMTSWFDMKQGRFPVLGVLDASERLVAFATYGSFRPWPANKYSVEHSLYVDKNWRGRGLGQLLLLELVREAEAQAFHTIIGGITSDNRASIRLHERCGFESCGTIRHAGFKFGRWLDLCFYQRILATPQTPVDG